MTVSHERFARNTTATLLLSRFQQPSMKNEVINNLQFQIYDVRNDQTKLSDSIKVFLVLFYTLSDMYLKVLLKSSKSKIKKSN